MPLAHDSMPQFCIPHLPSHVMSTESASNVEVNGTMEVQSNNNEFTKRLDFSIATCSEWHAYPSD